MGKPLRVLMVEDSEDDVLLMIRALKQGGCDPVYEQVEDALSMRKALEKGSWDIILCDYQMPQFDGLAAIALLKETGIDIPLIIVSGVIGEETAVACMRSGAQDYVMKGNLSRLVPAIERELKEAESRIQRRQAEEALKESENKYRLLAENVNDVIFALDMNLNYTYVSPSVKFLRGYEPEEVLKHSPHKTLTPSSWDQAVRTLSEVMELEKSGHREIQEYRSLELEMWRKDGTTVWTEVKFSFLRDENHQAVGILGVTRDITERKQADKDLKETLESLRKAVGATIQAMVSAVEARDPYTSGHQIRSANLARAIATEMGLPREKIEGVRMAGSIHDIGKLSIPAEILSKPTKLTNIEFSLIKEHSQKGYEMLKDVESPWPLAEIVYQHHERMDGTGYPRNLIGEDILTEARILAVADVVESMASHRPYRPAIGIKAALEEIEKNKGILYDDAVADACLRLFRDKGFQLELA
jgi:PAS domain S-box-containing protein/putative nucleotidyltransferase with HDIG domain